VRRGALVGPGVGGGGAQAGGERTVLVSGICLIGTPRGRPYQYCTGSGHDLFHGITSLYKAYIYI